MTSRLWPEYCLSKYWFLSWINEGRARESFKRRFIKRELSVPSDLHLSKVDERSWRPVTEPAPSRKHAVDKQNGGEGRKQLGIPIWAIALQQYLIPTSSHSTPRASLPQSQTESIPLAAPCRTVDRGGNSPQAGHQTRMLFLQVTGRFLTLIPREPIGNLPWPHAPKFLKFIPRTSNKMVSRQLQTREISALYHGFDSHGQQA